MLAYKCSTQFPIRAGEVQFGLLSSDEIERMSTCHVKDTTIYYRGLPNPNGINDHRMGTVDRRLLCGTCCKDVRHCQGHIGHIKLSFPMYHIGFFDTTFKCLRCVCFACAKLCLTDEEKELVNTGEMGKNQFSNVYNMLKNKKKCPHCGISQPNYVRNPLNIKAEWNDDFESEEEKEFCTKYFTQRDALSILNYIPDEDCMLMGLNPKICHPKNMILTTILVPPPVARPAIMASEGSRSRGQDDLTHKLQDINKRSIELFNFMEEKHWTDVEVTPEMAEKINKLQFEVFTYMNNNIRGQKQSTQRSGAPTKSLTDRLRGKDGRIRGNLMGKRVDFSARSVITPDAVMDVDQVGIPEKIAMALTIPERVTSVNIESLTNRVCNGTGCINGAESVVTSNGVMINLNHCENREKIRLQYGWIVERYLQDDDIVIFNRQPSLHKMGMMGHRVKLMKGSTFRLNLCCANPYNADFDGDEMNLHVPQSPAAQADVAMLMMVSRQVISPQANKPVMGIVQDSLLSAHLFSHNDVFLDRLMACHLIAVLKYTNKELPEPCILSPTPLWSGKQLLSLIIPNTMSLGLEYENGNIKEHTKCFIRNGQILTGILNKSLLGSSAGGFVDILFREYGSSIVIRWMSEIQRLVNAWLMIRGFSVSIKDCVISEKGEERVKERITTAMRYAEELLKEPIEKGSPEHSVLESTIVRILSKTLMQTGGIVDEELDPNNAIRSMVNAGSKGNPINLSQICGCVGQQSVEGHRVFPEKGGRTLTCFEKIDNSLAGQGFVQNSYALGLHPHEYFFHAMGGREGLVDTAVKTATTGYIQRRQIKAMEDHKVCYDGTVRNAEEAIIDFSYGGDGMDAARIERVRLNLLKESVESICERMTQWEAEQAMYSRDIVLKGKINVLSAELDTRILLPFNPYRMHLKHTIGEQATYDEIEEIVKEYVQKKTSAIYRATLLDFFCTSKLYAASLSVEEIKKIFKSILDKWITSKINYGEMVGSIAAQSIGEPCTQMTLNSVDWNTHMAIHWTANYPAPAPHDAEVGQFIDALIDSRQQDVQIQPDGVTIYLPLPKGSATALSADEDGNMMWTELEAVTRHPPINKDGSNTLMKVTTESGHEVTVTKGKSLLVERNGKLVEVNGDEVSIGDRVPIAQELPNTNITHLNLHSVFAEYEVVFTNTMIEAIEAAKADRHWFLKGAFKNRCCYSRSDILMDAMKKRPQLKTPDMVAWPMGQSALLPVEIILDREFGFFIGAFLSEGALTDHQVHIANVDPTFREACKVWPERYGIKSHITNEKHQKKNNGKSISVMFHSTFLVNLLIRTCGKGSYNKRVPSFAMVAPTDFIEGLLDGYISGDGSISKKQTYISAHSRSKALRDGIVLLLSKFGIDSKLKESLQLNHIEWSTEDDGRRTQKKYGEFKPVYSFALIQENAIKFARNIHLTLEYKQRRQDEILESVHKCMKTNTLYMKDVKLDEIMKIEEISSSHEFVYDLTVAKTRNMTTVSGFVNRDTFHFAGVISKNVTLGIPRLKELLDQAKTIKTPSNTIRLIPELSKNREFAAFLADTLPLTRLSDIVSSCDFVYDPDDDCPGSSSGDQFMVDMNALIGIPRSETDSNYVIRLILNQSLMKTRRITPPIVRTLLRNRLHGKAHVISSETNDVDWVIRIRLEEMRTMMSNFEVLSREREGLLCHRVMSVLLDTVAISGHKDIQASFVRDIDVNGEKHYVVDTQGCNLMDLSAVPCIDWYNTISNDLNEIHATLGLEAAVAILYNELTVTISFDGTYVDPRHIMMIVNTMCRGGYIMPLSRHGINRMDTGPLLRCSFEETPDILCDAACFGEVDNGKGVSQNIMTGKLAGIGSGYVNLMMNPSMMHPRAIKLETMKGKRVLKSRVRLRPSQPTQVELFEITKDETGGPSNNIELPFDNFSEAASSTMNDDNIFASNICEAPYKETDTTPEVVSAPNTIKSVYRPSSPVM